MTLTTSASPPPLTGSNWWQRNWKWFLPVLVIGGGTATVGGIALFVMGISGILKSSDAYREALARAMASSQVQEALGNPLEAGDTVTGEIKLINSGGRASLSIPIQGPNGKATIRVRAMKADGRWTFSRMVVTIDATGQEIDLNSAPAGAIERVER